MRDEAAYEAAIDAMVQRQLAVDPRYRNAENAEEQAEAEAAIEREIIERAERQAFRLRAEQARIGY
jgi:hypothetical protein